MKKSILPFASLLLGASMVVAQDFPGYGSGNYIGVNGVFSNPANIVDSRYHWDFNLFGVSIFAGNNNASLGLKDFGKNIDVDTLFFPANGQATDGMALVAVNGPSLFFNLNKKSSIALTTQVHALVNAFNFDGKLIRQLLDAKDNAGFPYTIASSENMVVNENGYASLGLSYARTIYDKGRHFLKGGITFKYLSGFTNTSVNVDKLHATIDQDGQENTTLNNASGNVALGFGGVDFSGFNADDLLKFENTGFGMDIGLVYEFRPHSEEFLLSFDSSGVRKDLNKYKFKVGLSILNLGGIKYHRDMEASGAFGIHIADDQYFDLSALTDGDLVDYNKTLQNYPQFFTAESGEGQASTYRMSLPTTMQLFVDYHLHRGFYVSLASQLSLVGTTDKPFNSRYYNALSLTPRYEGRKFGWYVPISQNSITGLNAGMGLRFGFLYLGSGSILTALAKSKQADVYFGIRFGSLQINKDKQYKKLLKK